MDCIELPIEGSETRVVADDEKVLGFMTRMQDRIEEVCHSLFSPNCILNERFKLRICDVFVFILSQSFLAQKRSIHRVVPQPSFRSRGRLQCVF